MTLNSSISFTTLANGMRIVHEAMPWLPSVSFSLLLPYGAVNDETGYEGSSSVLTDWMERGTKNLSSRALSDTFDDLGVRRGGGSGKEYSSFSGSLLADSFADTLALFRDVIREPLLDDSEFVFAQSLALQELASLADSPTQQLFETLSRRFFSSNHGSSSYGTQAGLQALSAEQLRVEFTKRLSPEGAILSVAGGISWEEVTSLANTLFSDWQSPALKIPAVSFVTNQQAHLEEESSQTQIGVAYKGVGPGQHGWYETALATNALSGGMGARLFVEVREKRGLVYSVAAVNRTLKDFGYTLAYAGTTPDRADETLDVLLAELLRLKQGISQDELERARTGLLSSLVMQGESSGARASALARDTFLLGKPREMDIIKNALLDMNLETVNSFLAEHYNPEFHILSLGPKALSEVAA